MTVTVRAPVLTAPAKKRWPAEQQPANVCALPVITPPPPPTNLGQLQLEFDTGYRPKKWLDSPQFPNICVLPTAPVIAPALQIDFPAPKKKWPAEFISPNATVLAPPIYGTPPPLTYDFPGVPKKHWPQEAPLPNVAAQPVGTVIAPFHYDYPAKPKKVWPVEANPPNVCVLPTAAPPFTQHDIQNVPRKLWKEDWRAPNVTAALPVGPPVFPLFFDALPKKRWPSDFRGSSGLAPSGPPIYTPWGPGYVVYLPARSFTLATLVRTFTVILPWRAFTISRTTVQTFDVKDPAESWPLTFNMAPDLSTGETLVGIPNVSITVSQGSDPSPYSILNGPAGFDASLSQVVQPVTAGINGCEYAIAVTCSTSNPLKVLTLVGALPVRRE